MTLADVTAHNSTLLTVFLILGIVCALFFIFGRR